MDHRPFEESIRDWSIACLYCRRPSDGSEDVKDLAIGHVMHLECYDAWLREQDDLRRLKSKIQSANGPVVLLPGEEGLLREAIARRRTAQLFGKRKGRGGGNE
jgi:hypothetical protein